MGYFCLPPGAAHVRRRAFGGMRSTAPLGAPLFHSSFGGARAWAQSDSPSPPWSEWRPSRGGLAARARARFGSALPKAQDRLGSSRDRPRAAIALEPRSPSSLPALVAGPSMEPGPQPALILVQHKPPAHLSYIRLLSTRHLGQSSARRLGAVPVCWIQSSVACWAFL